MRIAMVASPQVPVPPPKYGGSELVVANLIKGLKERGHEVILLGSGDSRIDCELIPIVDKAIYFPATKAVLPQFNKRLAQINKQTGKTLRALLPRLDIIHSHGYDMRPFQDFPNVTTIHGMIGFNSLPNNLSYYLARRDFNWVSISKNQQKAITALNYIDVAHNGEDPADFPIVEKPKDYVCFLGRFDRDKNPHQAIELAINLGTKIKIAGKIDYLAEGYFQEEVERYLKHPLVEYLGELDFKDKVKLLSGAKCNLHPTGFREPFGLTVLEAAYCGTPTLALARGSMPELIEDGHTGLLLEDFVEGYENISRCYEMDRGYIARRARRLFNYQRMSLKYLRAYRKVIKNFKPNE